MFNSNAPAVVYYPQLPGDIRDELLGSLPSPLSRSDLPRLGSQGQAEGRTPRERHHIAPGRTRDRTQCLSGPSRSVSTPAEPRTPPSPGGRNNGFVLTECNCCECNNNDNSSIYLYIAISPDLKFCSEALITQHCHTCLYNTMLTKCI